MQPDHTNKTLNIATQAASSLKPIGSKWVLKTKRNLDGTILYKVRVAIRGYLQSDWGETCTNQQAGFTSTLA